MAAEVGLSVLGKIAELLIEPVQRELGYLFCFNTNFQELQTLLEDLIEARNYKQGREDAEKRMGKTLDDCVKSWIEKADGKIVEAEGLIREKAELQKGCFSIKWCPNISLRSSLGRKGKKLSLLLIELLQRGRQLPNEGHALPMPSINMSDYNGDARDFVSRSRVMEDVINMLLDEETMLIGICGMGGIGKTTFARQVLQKVKDSHKHLFEFQVVSTVSNSPNFIAIQQEVAQGLGISLKDVDGEIHRANHLRNAFSNKKVVVLLDDVWQQFDLKAKGFPLTKSDGVGCYCKIIYTSRHQNLWLREPTFIKKEIALQLLTSDEAWNLFKRKVDLKDVDIDFHWKNEKGRKIVEGCGGLPLALEVVGGALIERDQHEWDNMLSQFRNHGQNEHINKIHEVLETSYHFLQDLNAQFLFLLCCLFPEDAKIPIETLYRYVVGLQLFKGINDLKGTRANIYTSVDNLIRRNLIINTKIWYGEPWYGERAVKMHDEMRNVGISIARQEKNGIHFLECDDVNKLENVFTPHAKMISILFKKNGLEVPDMMKFPGLKLELLRLDSFYFRINGNLFEGTNNLKVLDTVRTYPLFSSLSYLANLKMLSLEKLNMTTNVSFIGHIKCLEVLSFRSSTMKDLPNEIGELTNLRLLDLTDCTCFISNGILSKLTNLQELYIWNSFEEWRLQNEDVNGGSNNAAGLDELNWLRQLWRLELDLPNIQQVPRGVRLLSSSTLLEQFKIRVGGRNYIKFESGERRLWLENAGDNTSFLQEFGFLIEKGITSLYLCADSGMLEKMYLNNFHLSLNDVVLKRCGSLFPPSQSKSSHISNKEEIFIGRNFRRIEIYECNQMRHLCSTSISRNLKNLQVLVLQECEMIEEVVCYCDKRERLNKIEFNALETLKLRDLFRLECFCKGINVIHFHKLKTLELKGLKKFIFPTKLEIPCLKEMSMKSIPNIETLCNIILPPSLQKLEIVSCDNFQYVDFSHKTEQLNKIEFNALETLKLRDLSKLECFCKGINVIHFHKLKTLELKGLKKFIFPTKLEIPCLEEICMESIPNIETLCNILPPSLQKLSIVRCDNFQYVDFSHNLVISRLKSLIIKGCKMLKGVVGVTTTAEEQRSKSIGFPNLSTLKLESLDELASFVIDVNNLGDKEEKSQSALFYYDDYQVSFPNLKGLEINELAKINYIVGWKEREKGHHRLHYNHNDKIFPVLRELEIFGLSNLIHMYEINQPGLLGVLLFQNLTHLTIDGCEKLRYLFSENIGRVAAKHLRMLDIYDCGMMEVVMKKLDDEEELIIEDDDHDKAEEEGSNSVGNSHFFPLLVGLSLRKLSGLRRFSDVAYTWALPTLEYLLVRECPKLEALSPGYLDSPKLDTLQYYGTDNNRKEENVKNTWKGDVNTALHHLFIKTQKQEDVEEEESEDVEEEEEYEQPIERPENMDDELVNKELAIN